MQHMTYIQNYSYSEIVHRAIHLVECLVDNNKSSWHYETLIIVPVDGLQQKGLQASSLVKSQLTNEAK